MARLPDIEVRRLLAYLKNRIADREQLSIIEDELGGEDGTDFLREPEFLPYFSASNVELVVDNASWQLRIIAYTNMRMIQRGISQEIVLIYLNDLSSFVVQIRKLLSSAHTQFLVNLPRKINRLLCELMLTRFRTMREKRTR